MKRKIKAVLFDIDGTMIDSQLALYYLFKDALDRFEEKHKTKKEILNPMGATSKVWIKRLVPRVSPEKMEKMRAWIAYEYAKHYMERFAKPMKYSTYVLKQLRKNKIKVGIVTNQHRNQENVSTKIIKFNKFNAVVTSDDVRKPKPDPESLFVALKKLKVKRDEVIYIGDTINDLKTGKAAGVRTYLIKHSYNKHIRCNKINTLKEVLRLVL